jgi:peptide/nickel transport system permease protein
MIKENNKIKFDYWKNYNKTFSLIKIIFKNKEFLIGFFISFFFIIISFFGNYFVPYNPNSINLNQAFLPPSLTHLFGTDYLGRDVFSRTIVGGTVSIEVGLVAGLLVIIIGSIIGILSGYYGGVVDILFQRIVDIILALPIIVFVLALLTIINSSTFTIILAVSFLSWPSLSRIVRAETLSLKEKEFILAEKLAGASGFHIIFKHLIPNEISSIIVYSGLAISNAILVQAALAYLGFSGSSVSWGFDLYMAQQYIMGGYWWMALFPGLAITLTALGFYLISEGLRKVTSGG